MTKSCGYIAIIGAPNAGKSTLVNRLVGTKVSIVTHKVQTTRTRILGLYHEGESQVILVDTPGIFKPSRRLERAMVEAAWKGMSDADLTVLVVDCLAGFTPKVERIIEQLRINKRKVALALNKIDGIEREKLLMLAQKFTEAYPFAPVFMISALKGHGINELKSWGLENVPEGPWLFPDDQLSDMSERLLSAEITREKLFLNIHQEIPYHLTVETDKWERTRKGDIKITQIIYVQREGHKIIVLGEGGKRIKAIGKAARLEISELLGKTVHLFLIIKVRKRWEEDPARFEHWNLDFDA